MLGPYNDNNREYKHLEYKVRNYWNWFERFFLIEILLFRWADDIESVNRNGVSKKFDHPFFQACCMFLGEFLCLIVFKVLYYHYKRKGVCNSKEIWDYQMYEVYLFQDGSEDVMELTKGNRDFNPFKLFIPAMCDMTATSIMYIGLTLTYSSSFQMFRGQNNKLYFVK